MSTKTGVPVSSPTVVYGNRIAMMAHNQYRSPHPSSPLQHASPVTKRPMKPPAYSNVTPPPPSQSVMARSLSPVARVRAEAAAAAAKVVVSPSPPPTPPKSMSNNAISSRNGSSNIYSAMNSSPRYSSPLQRPVQVRPPSETATQMGSPRRSVPKSAGSGHNRNAAIPQSPSRAAAVTPRRTNSSVTSPGRVVLPRPASKVLANIHIDGKKRNASPSRQSRGHPTQGASPQQASKKFVMAPVPPPPKSTLNTSHHSQASSISSNSGSNHQYVSPHLQQNKGQTTTTTTTTTPQRLGGATGPVSPRVVSPSPSLKSSGGGSTFSSGTTAVPVSPFLQSSAGAAEWRKHGKLYRAQVLLMDEEKGGNTFQLSNECSIERYYRVAERVLEQFLSTSIRESHESAESYLVGNRLVKFLSMVLPTHPQYFSKDPHLEALRQRSQSQLVELLRYLEELALHIDEAQYNKYILRDLTPEERDLVGELTGRSPLPKASMSSSTSVPSTRSARLTSNASWSTTASSVGSVDSFGGMSKSMQKAVITATPKEEEEEVLSIPQQEQQSPTVNHSTLTESSVSTLSIKDADTLQKRVARVVQVTEAFSDTIDTMRGNGGVVNPGNTNNGRKPPIPPPAANSSPPPPLHPSNRHKSPQPTRSNSSSKPPIQPNSHYHQYLRKRSPSPIRNASSRSSSPLSPRPPSQKKESTDGGNAPQTPVSSTNKPTLLSWEQDFFSFAEKQPESSKSRSTHSRIDLLEQDDFFNDARAGNPQNKLPTATSTSSTNTATTTASSDSWPSPSDAERKNKPSTTQQDKNAHVSVPLSPIPKLKEPPKFPSRTIRAKAAAACHFDFKQNLARKETGNGISRHKVAPILFDEWDDEYTNRGVKKSDDSLCLSRGSPLVFTDAEEDDAGIPFKTKIEERWERASAVQKELDMSMDQSEYNHMIGGNSPEVLNRWRTTKRRGYSPDMDNDGTTTELTSSNKSLLRHFKGCVQCLLD